MIKRCRKCRGADFTFTQRPTDGQRDAAHVAPRAEAVPMSLQRTASGRRISVTNLAASRRISMTLLSSANAGASGKEATNRDTKPYWMTAGAQTADTQTHASIHLLRLHEISPQKDLKTWKNSHEVVFRTGRYLTDSWGHVTSALTSENSAT